MIVAAILAVCSYWLPLFLLVTAGNESIGGRLLVAGEFTAFYAAAGTALVVAALRLDRRR